MRGFVLEKTRIAKEVFFVVFDAGDAFVDVSWIEQQDRINDLTKTGNK